MRIFTHKIHETFGALSALLSDFECHVSDLSALDQSERRIRWMPRAERGPPARAREDTLRAGRATGDACVDVPRVYPRRGAPIFASARRRGAGEAARQRV